MSKSKKRSKRAAETSSRKCDNSVKGCSYEAEAQRAARPLSVEEFAKKAAALRRQLRSSIDSTEIIRAHRDGNSVQ